jgi:hypothetical protein
MAAGADDYMLTCANPNGNAQNKVTLTVQAPPSGGGGGGSLDAVALIALLTFGCARALRPRVAREPLRG